MSATENTIDITDTPKSNEESVTPKIEDHVPKKVSYLGLFKYSTFIEKIMVILGVLGAIMQGVTMPLM